MTKEEYIEQWIETNNPYEVEVYPDPMDPFMFLGGIEDDTKKKMWKEGAMAMANNLTNQPPTKEQLVKALKLLADYGGYVGYTDEKNAEVILQHWNDEQ